MLHAVVVELDREEGAFEAEGGEQAILAGEWGDGQDRLADVAEGDAVAVATMPTPLSGRASSSPRSVPRTTAVPRTG